MRRLLDCVVSAAALVVLAPIMGLIAIRIRRDDPGPALFRQTRVGRHGSPFTILKFRTMPVDSDQSVQVTSLSDARVSRPGRFLRRTKLDELPQLWNVLVGDMSLVGPRPEVPQYVALWPAEDRTVVLSVRPGLTDPYIVNHPDEAELLATQQDPAAFYTQVLLPSKLRVYREYVAQRTLAGDTHLFLRTLSGLIGR
jgi:lipopolysaccharide/colanic/teichoic acid biosynthesis glycosyltransferase